MHGPMQVLSYPSSNAPLLKRLRTFLEFSNPKPCIRIRGGVSHGVEDDYVKRAIRAAQRIYVLQADSQLYGFLLAKFPRPDTLYIDVVCSLPGASARPLIEQAIHDARKEHKRYVDLKALGNVRTYYPRFGFVALQNSKNNPVDGWLHRKNLSVPSNWYAAESVPLEWYHPNVRPEIMRTRVTKSGSASSLQVGPRTPPIVRRRLKRPRSLEPAPTRLRRRR